MVDKWISCKLIDFATTPKILSQMSPFNLELFPLARNFVNQVLCSKALTEIEISFVKKIRQTNLVNQNFEINPF